MKFLFLMFLAVASGSGNVSALPAFPGAEGFGSTATGGRGGQVIYVTNLNDSGPGSLRAALTTTGPRIVLFAVSGTIELDSMIDITKDNLTVVGNTAPGDGITIKNSPNNIRAPIRISADNVIMRYLRIRPGGTPVDSGEIDGITMVGNATNVIIDHCSFSWSTDELFQSGKANDFTLSWNIFAEGLNDSTHPTGLHSKGPMFSGDADYRVSMHHNFIAHNFDRNPNINARGTFDFVNNVVYNAGKTWMEIKDEYGDAKVNVVNNFHIHGPNSRTTENYEVKYTGAHNGNPEVYVSGNIGRYRTSKSVHPDENIVAPGSRWMISSTPFAAPAVTTYDVWKVRNRVFDGYDGFGPVGASLPIRDAHDERVIAHVPRGTGADLLTGTGAIIDDPADVGGWLYMQPGNAIVDTDGDGMPDAWETARCLNPNNASDGILDRNNDGYTNVEEYIYGMNQPLNCN